MADPVHHAEDKEHAMVEAAQFQLFMDQAPDAIVIVDSAERIVFVNAQAEETFGYRRDELLGQKVETLVPDVFRADHASHPADGLAAPRLRPKGASLELVGRRKDGSEFPVEINLRSVQTPDGLRVMAVIRDVTARKRAETERRQIDERFRLLVREVKDYAIFLLDPTGHIVTWNEGAERIKGYRAAEILGKYFSVFYPPEDVRRGKPQQLLKRAAAEGRVEDEGWRVRKNGSRFWADVVITALRDDQGRLVGFAKVTRDLTERRRIEEELRHGEESLARAQQIAHMGNWEWDIRTNQVRWSDEVYRIFGARRSAFGATYEAFLQFVHPDDREMVQTAIRDTLTKKKPYRIDHRIVRSDGSERVVHSDGDVFFDDAGHPSRMIGTVQDITERWQVEQERARHLASEQALAQIAQALVREIELDRIANVVITQSRTVLGADTVALWLADPTRRELNLLANWNLAPETVAAIRHVPYDSSLVVTRTARTEQIQAIEDLDSHAVPAEVPRVYLRESWRSLLDAPLISRGRLVGVVSYAYRTPRRFTPQDVQFNRTVADLFAVAIENARLYDQVRQTLRVREEFMATAAHELRTPVTVIKGRAQWLLKTDAQDPRVRQGLEAVVHQSDRIALLIENLLSVVRLYPGATALRRERVDLVQLTQGLIARIAPTSPQHQFQLVSDGPLVVECDRDLISEVLTRLVENALRYAPEGGPIELSARSVDGEAVVAITDHGVGIDPERLPRVFEPFVEPVPPGAPGYIGIVSLGLYLSKQIVETHGGRIWVTSSPGKGSTFFFSLPLQIAQGA